MRPRRSRPRRRRSSRPVGGFALLAVGVVLLGSVVGGGALATGSFTTGHAPRGTAVNVTADERAAHALSIPPSVRVNDTTPLVNVTNRLGRDTTVTVTLRDDSQDAGDLVVDGSASGDRASVFLPVGATETVSIAVPDDDTLVGVEVYFHVDADADGFAVSAPDRNTTVVS